VIIQLVLIQVVTFVVVIVALRFLFGSHLKTALNRLQVLHQQSLEKEEILNKELEKARIQSQGEISRAKEEAKLILDTAKRHAEDIALEAAGGAQEQSKKIMAEASERAKKLEAEVLAGAQEKAMELAQELIRATFAPKGQAILHSQLIDELIDDLRAVDKGRLAVKVDKAEVATSAPLTSEEKKKLEGILVSKLGYELPLEEKIDETLIIGIVIKLGGLVADGSLKNKLNKALNEIRSR
jgi:F0F1-type ATP synthase delta subunit